MLAALILGKRCGTDERKKRDKGLVPKDRRYLGQFIAGCALGHFAQNCVMSNILHIVSAIKFRELV